VVFAARCRALWVTISHTRRMGQKAPRAWPPARQQDVYARRRVVALALGLGALSLLAWGINGAVGGVSRISQAARVTRVPHRAHLTSPATGPGAGPAGSPVASASPHQRPAPSPARSRPRPARTASPAPAAGTVGLSRGCPPGDVVVRLFPSQGSYGSHALPEFDVDMVSTAPRSCAVNVGARYLWLVVRSGGIARVWSSAGCATGAGSRVVWLARGVPLIRHVTWDRKTSSPGCRQARAVVRPGTYTATATAVVSGVRRSSDTKIFVLSGAEIAVP